ncbi:unnamed protein product [Wuchereria bancrofti]|uniref:Uncharacterized protein n=1 Tax=Wuchereria bancrofti TaxID=6293 RepID=A0A3P7DDY7_WUCBA|nr:unnamed protein product [Wuchereria bancrofti]
MLGNYYVYDVHMDISHQFFPLPSVAVPNITINRPSMTEYSFESERKAIADYEKNKAALTIKVKEMKTKNVNSERSSIVVEKTPDITCGLYTRKVHSNAILEPSRVVVTTSQQQNTKQVKPAMNTFEEFELKPNLFDLLELRTIDDKAALEQILANAPPPLSPNAVGSSAQSSSGLLSSSSIPNMGLKVSESDNAHSLYNFSTLKSYNGSFGIGVPSASFRQNL